MRELFTMWRNTRMIVLVAISAAAYVAVLLPFKGFVIVPGLTEVRPGAAIPVVLSFLLGPAAAWGSGFGNVIADTLGGMLTPVSLFGFFGNVLYGFVPYAMWRAFMGRRNPVRSGLKGWLVIALILATNALVIGSLIGWGAELLHLAPFAALGLIITVNNFIASAAIATILLALLYDKARNWGLLYYQVLDDEDDTAPAPSMPEMLSSGTGRAAAVATRRPRRIAAAAAVVLIAGAVLAFTSGLLTSGETLQAGYGAAAFAARQSGSFLVAVRMIPGIVLIFLAAAFL